MVQEFLEKVLLLLLSPQNVNFIYYEAKRIDFLRM